jgi:hypothetical protein
MMMAGAFQNVANAAAMPFAMQGYKDMGLFGKPGTSTPTK